MDRLLIILFILPSLSFASKGIFGSMTYTRFDFEPIISSGTSDIKASAGINTEFGFAGTQKFSRTVSTTFEVGLSSYSGESKNDVSLRSMNGNFKYSASYLFVRLLLELTNDDKFGFLFGYGIGKVMSASLSGSSGEVDIEADSDYAVPDKSAFYTGIETKVIKFSNYKIIPRLMFEFNQSNMFKQASTGDVLKYGLTGILSVSIMLDGKAFE